MPSDLWHKYIQAYKILSIHLFFYPFYPSIYLYSVYPIIHPSINLAIYPSNQQLMHASIQPFIDLFIYSTIILFIVQSIHTLYIQIYTIQTYIHSHSIFQSEHQLNFLPTPVIETTDIFPPATAKKGRTPSSTTSTASEFNVGAFGKDCMTSAISISEN